MKNATGIIIVLKLGDSGDYKVMLRCEQVRIGMGLILDLYRELGVFYRAIQKGYRKIKEDRNVSKNFNNLTEVVQCRF